jgi:release factor glutamine methyltransferase
MEAQNRPESRGSRERIRDGPWTVGRVLTWTTDFLKQRGSETPRLDAEVMLAHVLAWDRVQIYVRFEQEIDEAARSGFRELVRRRAEGAPVAYLVGRKEFYSLSFRVSPAVLIPRPDSEFVVVAFLEVTRDLVSPAAVDVGTGSGCLAIASTHHHPTARFIATDISEKALEIAQDNAKVLGVADRIEFRIGNQLDPVAEDGPFDAIVSNPPYIPTSELMRLESGVRDYEPHTALDGGESGLAVVGSLIEQSARLLKPGGHLILEIGDAQEIPVRKLIAAQRDYQLGPTVYDHSSHPRVIRATRTK